MGPGLHETHDDDIGTHETGWFMFFEIADFALVNSITKISISLKGIVRSHPSYAPNALAVRAVQISSKTPYMSRSLRLLRFMVP